MLKDFNKIWTSFGFNLKDRNDKKIKGFWKILIDFRAAVTKAKDQNEKIEQRRIKEEEKARKKKRPQKPEQDGKQGNQGLTGQLKAFKELGVAARIAVAKKKDNRVRGEGRRRSGVGRRGIRRKK